jgi:hypothetical protein
MGADPVRAWPAGAQSLEKGSQVVTRKVRWLVQKEGFSMANREDTIEVLERFGFAHDSFGILASSGKVLNLENILSDPEERFIVRGGTRLFSLVTAAAAIGELGDKISSDQARYGTRYLQQLKSGIFYDERTFDQAYYSGLGLPLLNGDATMYPIAANLKRTFGHEKFIKPSKDEKAFDAGILAAGETIEAFIARQPQARGWQDEVAVIAPCKEITAEYRFFVVRGEVVTGSLYRFAGKANFSANIPGEILDAASAFARLYQPHQVFTMDLAETSDGIRIIEYNCWNASRLYATDAARIFHAVQDYVMEKK